MVKRVREVPSEKAKGKTQKKVSSKSESHSRQIIPDVKLPAFLSKYPLLVFGVLLAVILVIVFRDYIFMNRLFLFKDIGSDTINTFYPSYVLLSETAREGLSYSFRSGMGAGMSAAGKAFANDWVSLLLRPFRRFLFLWEGKDIAYGLGLAEVLKIFAAGMVFFAYLRTLKLENIVAGTGALLFAFSGFMIGGSGWYQHSYQLLFAALLLFGFEQALMKKRYWVFLLVTAMAFRTLNPFYMYVFGTFLIIYSLMRVILEKTDAKSALLFYAKTAGMALIAALINLPFLLQRIETILTDPRVSGNLNKAEQMQNISVFAAGDFLHNVTALLRFFSNDILGTGRIEERFIDGQRFLFSDFKGYYNYYEAPMFYIGMVSLLLFPQIFARGTPKERVIFGLFFIVWLIPVIFPYFRRAYFLFFGDYYRVFSFFLPFAVLFPALVVFNRLIKTGLLKLRVLWITAAVLLILLYYPYFSDTRLAESGLKTSPVNGNIRLFASFSILALTGLLSLFVKQSLNRPRWLYAALILIIAELIYMADTTVNDRDALSAAEFESKTGYNDYTVEAVNYLHETDSSFYRTEKDYASGPAVHGSLNDAKVQGYFGTTSYASHQNPYYVDFMQTLEIIAPGDETAARWSTGVRSRALLAVMTNVKYMLSKSDEPYFTVFGYEPIHTAGDVTVYKNQFNLPLGYTYHKIISRSHFEQLPQLQKDISMLRAAVLPDSIAEKYADLQKYQPQDSNNYTKQMLKADVDSLSRESMKLTSFREDHIRGQIRLSEPGIVFFSIIYNKNWEIRINDKLQEALPVNIAFTGLYLEAGEYELDMRYEHPKPPTGAGVGNVLMLLIFFGVVGYEGYAGWRKRK